MPSLFPARVSFCTFVALMSGLTTACVSHAAPTKSAFKFDFGSGRAAAGAIAITPATSYTPELGYGFEPGATIEASKRGDFLTSSKPFLFSIALPEGNYTVTLGLGDRDGESNTTVKAESRRLMLQNVSTARGAVTTRSFTVNIRNATLKSGQKVRLKGREIGVYHWDDKLTLEFNGARPCIDSVEIAAAPNAATVYIAGDSTVTDQVLEPWAAWGQMLPRFFGPNVAVANYAESGETLRAFAGEKRLEKILDTIKTGDYLFVQFGHNDQKDKGEGVGAFTTYSDSLRQFVTAARERGATPVLLTAMERRRFNPEGKAQLTLGDYPEAVRRVAKELQTPLIDLNTMSMAFYEALGPEKSLKAFVHYPANTFPGQTTALKDNTHFNAYGAFQLARAVVEGIKTNVPTLAKHLSADVVPFDPSKPDSVDTWSLPPSATFALQKPDGS